jgi:hypothetical protein
MFLEDNQIKKHDILKVMEWQKTQFREQMAKAVQEAEENRKKGD